MPSYTPPAGNVVDFNFTVTPYTPPTSTVSFNFNNLQAGSAKSVTKSSSTGIMFVGGGGGKAVTKSNARGVLSQKGQGQATAKSSASSALSLGGQGQATTQNSASGALSLYGQGQSTSKSSAEGDLAGRIIPRGTSRANSSGGGFLDFYGPHLSGSSKAQSRGAGVFASLDPGEHVSQVVLETVGSDTGGETNVSQVVLETLGPDAEGETHVSQVVLETLGSGTNTSSEVRVSQVVLETLGFIGFGGGAVGPGSPLQIAYGSELRFPPAISYGAYGGSSGWSTSVVATDNGSEYRIGKWGRSLGQWVVGHNLRRAVDWQALIALHRLTQGRFFPIRFQDWTDFTVTAGQGITVLNSAGQIQLAKVYQLTDEISFVVYKDTRPIYKPQIGTVIFANPILGVTLDYATGVIHGTGVAAGTTTWTGQFDVSVRFDEDNVDFSVDQPGDVSTGKASFAGGWRSIRLLEVRPKTP